MADKPSIADQPQILKSGFARWPHLFCRLAQRYDVPSDMLLTLLFLWDATVGANVEGMDDVARSQIPVRKQTRTKWLAALEAAHFFDKVKAKSGGANQTGSFWAYVFEVTEEEWEEFFWTASVLYKRTDNWDKVSTANFAKWFENIHGGGVLYHQRYRGRPVPWAELLPQRRGQWENAGKPNTR